MSGDISMGVYVRELCRAIDALHDFAGTVAGGASWWDDVWAGHEAAIDAARAALAAPVQEPLTVWITEGGCECLQQGNGPVRAMPAQCDQTGFTVPLYASPQAPQAVPAGFVLVPVEPTPEMLDAASLDCTTGSLRGAWRDMLAARPQAEQGGEG